MSDALQPAAVRRPGFLRRLLTTPFSDLLRGRVTGRRYGSLAAAEAAALPPAVRDAVDRVVRRAKLWPGERADVAAELRAHFADGLAAGASADDLLAAFGDERRAARLIRRAKIRNRPLVWRAARFAVRVTAVVLLAYAALSARFYLGRPTVATDYLAQLNALVERTPEGQRAWPLYERALDDLGVPGVSAGRTGDDARQTSRFARMIESRPGGRRWAELSAWVDARSAPIDRLRQAAARPALGFVMARDSTVGSAADPYEKLPPLMQVLLPYLSRSRALGDVLSADLRVARARGDAGRVVRDVEAMLGMADQIRGPFLVCDSVALGLDNLALQAVDETLADAPGVLADADLVRLAHGLARLGDRRPLVDLAGERLFFYDLVQRLYTDDGRGDGRFTGDGLRLLEQFAPMNSASPDSDPWRAAAIRAAGPLGVVASRRQLLVEYDRLMDLADAAYHRPARQADLSGYAGRAYEIKESSVERTRLLPIAIMLPGVGGSLAHAERALGKRDGLTVAVALELCRRRHAGTYPATLAELVPGLLPAVPVDRITGDPVRYRLAGGKPVVYSVGVDRDDDGGRRALGRDGKPWEFAAADWPRLRAGRDNDPPVDGDWVLFPVPEERDEPDDEE